MNAIQALAKTERSPMKKPGLTGLEGRAGRCCGVLERIAKIGV
ncbi:hypothetical protein HDEF_1061 [Candidatus Hamiltonella defensa 5AT (Acyrthosiphon pisum)]|uniref:Uncharacterized protein n=1 Tax=Hamiltonella defensa subsp. Acyrthosiphon pisum (strain 5AT) TaxID=572265 RepID=C4K5A2_HAMD5|nr:hypothetical protein HDEF_1061 [Candidatus Hamiltonella defensa 5AT (Acyrthosiphon pisum)]